MSPDLPPLIQELAYEEKAQEYLRSLPMEHFMEASAQSKQRAITVSSFELINARRPDIHIFSEMLVQMPLAGRQKLLQIVPDNMVVVTTERIRANLSFNVPLEPARPFWMFEYVSKGSKRKDYERSFRKYERDLKTPYYLTFYPDIQELSLYRLRKGKYVSVKPNRHGRCSVPELDMEVGIVDGWVRYWYEGELLPLPAELQRDLDHAKRETKEAKRQAEEAKHLAEEANHRADESYRQTQEAREEAHAERRRAEESQRQFDAERRRAADLLQRLEEAERALADRPASPEP